MPAHRDRSRQTPTDGKIRRLHATGHVSGNPIAEDAVSHMVPSAQTLMLGGALGAAFPFSTKTVIEPTGVRYGYHATTNAPITVDRWPLTPSSARIHAPPILLHPQPNRKSRRTSQ